MSFWQTSFMRNNECTIHKTFIFLEVPRPNMHISGSTCECDADYYGNHIDGCVPCPSGRFTRSQTGCTSVTQCICKFSHGNHVVSMVTMFFYGNHIDGCVKCPSWTFSRSQTRCTSVTQCICKYLYGNSKNL